MTLRTPQRLAAVLLAASLLAAAACGDDDAGDGAEPSGAADEVVLADDDALAAATTYADVAFASYDDVVTTATALQSAVDVFVAAPSEETLASAKQAWLDGRVAYGPTEVFRFYDGPIDDPEDGPEGRINAWPLDEAYLDYVVDDPTAGIINDVAGVPELTTDVLVAANEDGGETNISTGWHAIEFLLWGQDLSADGPGARPVTDYTTAADADRRGTYLTLLADLLVQDLTGVRDQWDPATGTYREAFLADPQQAVAHILRGMGALSAGELAGERIGVAYENKDQEDEHSCFSDNTTVDIAGQRPRHPHGVHRRPSGRGRSLAVGRRGRGRAGPGHRAAGAARRRRDQGDRAAGPVRPADPRRRRPPPGGSRSSRSSRRSRPRATPSRASPATSGTPSASRSIEERSRTVRRWPIVVLPLASAAVALLACSRGDDGLAQPTMAELVAQGGDGTVDVFGSAAFAQPVPGLDSQQRRTFAVGNNLFNDNWVTAPASTDGRDGLGPLFNAQSCSSCHLHDGRGRPPDSADDPVRGLLLRLGVVGQDGRPGPHPTLGDQLQDRAVHGLAPEGALGLTVTERPGRLADGTAYSLSVPSYEVLDATGRPVEGLLLSPRIAPGVFGVGLLEGVAAADLEALADPDDDDGDGISGRTNHVLDPATGALALGRFGWKANVATVRAQNAGAFAGDIGITSSLVPRQPCAAAQVDCAATPGGGDPELDDRKLDQVTFYTRTLAVPARRDVDQTDVRAGQLTFERLGCASCHLPELRTGASEVPALADQVIRPYTDLLLHDLGAGLADGRPDGEATGREWRTAPLWGIGLIETVNGHTRLLHDGRARNLLEAILWHGGEAAASRDRFAALDADERAQLVTFLESL